MPGAEGQHDRHRRRIRVASIGPHWQAGLCQARAEVDPRAEHQKPYSMLNLPIENKWARGRAGEGAQGIRHLLQHGEDEVQGIHIQADWDLGVWVQGDTDGYGRAITAGGEGIKQREYRKVEGIDLILLRGLATAIAKNSMLDRSEYRSQQIYGNWRSIWHYNRK